MTLLSIHLPQYTLCALWCLCPSALGVCVFSGLPSFPMVNGIIILCVTDVWDNTGTHLLLSTMVGFLCLPTLSSQPCYVTCMKTAQEHSSQGTAPEATGAWESEWDINDTALLRPSFQGQQFRLTCKTDKYWYFYSSRKSNKKNFNAYFRIYEEVSPAGSQSTVFMSFQLATTMNSKSD